MEEADDDMDDDDDDEMPPLPLPPKVTKTLQKQHKAYDKKVEVYLNETEVYDHVLKHNADPTKHHLDLYDNLPAPDPPTPPPIPEPEFPRPRIKTGDMPNFLKLSAALSILLARTISVTQLDTGYNFLLEYLAGFREVS